MRRKTLRAGTFSLLLALSPALLEARQQAGRVVSRFAIEPADSGWPETLALSGPVRPGAYVADLGRRAALLGDETGAFEVWVWPLKLVRDLRLAFRIPEYDEPIAAASVASRVTARPEGVTITYSHATFTVRQHVFVPLHEPGALMLLDVETVRPLDVVVQMHADFNLAWPGSFGGGFITWQAPERRFLLSQGGLRQYNGLIGSPFATEGTQHPAHDAPLVGSRFVLRFDPVVATGSYIPIVIAGGAASRDSVEAAFARILAGAERLWREKVEHYRVVRDEQLSLRSPEPLLDLALEWAKVNLDQQLVCNPELGCGLVAGFGRAGPANYRPGFGWYFGGDAAINTFAMNGLGQFDLVRRGLGFLGGYQRADGKIPHEISHAAKRLPWFTDYPYTWFHGDTTPFWILACSEYWRASGDAQFLSETWPSIVKAFRWSAATDRNGDGLMENPAAGAGAIEVGGLGENLLTDIYLAGVWVAALDGLRGMAAATADDDVAREVAALYERARGSLESRFWLERPGIYAFALLDGGATERPRTNDALTVWPTTALAFGLLDAERAARMLREVGSAAITTDWGTRMLSREHPLYEPLHYNNGTVWGFVTGFAAAAHYRFHRAWAGHELVRAVARSTFDFARGRNPELLSGAFYRQLDTSVPQQFFATSMFAGPLIRGLLGLRADAPARAATITPHLPADWDSADVRNFRVGDDRLSITIGRATGRYTVRVRRQEGGAAPLALRIAPALPAGARVRRVAVDGRDAQLSIEETPHDVHAVAEVTLVDEVVVDIAFDGGIDVLPAVRAPEVGEPSEALRVLDFRRDRDGFLLLVEGRAGASHALELLTATPESVRGTASWPDTERTARGLLLRFSLTGEAGSFVRREIRFAVRN